MNITLVDAILVIGPIRADDTVNVSLANAASGQVFSLPLPVARRLYEQLGRALQRAKETL